LQLLQIGYDVMDIGVGILVQHADVGCIWIVDFHFDLEAAEEGTILSGGVAE
jgi:hypothetical protein